MNEQHASGSCLCGAVGCSARLPPKWVAHCHCTRCQRAHGAAFVTWVGFEASAVEISNERRALSWFTTPEGADRGFCGKCGSPMFFRSGRWPGELHVARALFQDPLPLQPQSHVFHASRVPWITLCDGLPIEDEPS